MINAFKIRRYAAFSISGFTSVICFYIGLVYYGFLIAMGCMFMGLILGVVLGSLLIKNPFTMMMEGKGIMVLNLDSTGILRPSIVGLHSPYIRGKIGKKVINDVWDRSTVYQIAAPEQNKKKAEPDGKGGIKIEIDERTYNKARFQLFHFPTLIWNDQINSLLTKDFLASMEKQTFAEHGVLYLNRKMEELNSAVRDFGRHVVELTKPVKSIFSSKWTWIIIFIVLVIMAVLFAPAILNAMSSGGSTIAQTAGSTSSIIPK